MVLLALRDPEVVLRADRAAVAVWIKSAGQDRRAHRPHVGDGNGTDGPGYTSARVGVKRPLRCEPA